MVSKRIKNSHIDKTSQMLDVHINSHTWVVKDKNILENLALQQKKSKGEFRIQEKLLLVEIDCRHLFGNMVSGVFNFISIVVMLQPAELKL